MTLSSLQDFDKVLFDYVLKVPATDLAVEIAQAPDLQKTVNRMANIAAAVIKGLSNSSPVPEELLKEKKFLAKIKSVNQIICDQHGQSPFARTIEALATIPPPAAVQTSAIPEQPVTFDSIKGKINGLDLDDGELSKKIKEIQSDLKKLKDADGISNEQMQTLSEALDLLYCTAAFQPSYFERIFLERCAKDSPALQAALESKRLLDIVKEAQKKGRLEMFKIIKKSLNEPDSLVAIISNQHKMLEDHLITFRFLRLPPELICTSSFNKNFIKNLPDVIRNLEIFHNSYLNGFKKTWEEDLALRDKKFPGFSKALQQHPFNNPATYYTEILDLIQTNFLQLINLDKMNESTFINEYMNSIVEKTIPSQQDCFHNVYRINFEHNIDWLMENYTHVEKPYNQALEAHTNLAEGVCAANCLDRHRNLLKNPALPNKDIQLGSSPHTRFAQAIYNNEPHRSCGRQLAKRMGLKRIKKISVPRNKKNPTKHLGDTLDQAYKDSKQKLLATFSLNHPLDDGHRINIQMDCSVNQFRFIDDNFGICSFDTYKKFKHAFIKYLKSNYSEYSSFSIRRFKLI